MYCITVYHLNTCTQIHRSLHNQLLHENPRENSSLKRVNILKTQVFQLERQVCCYHKDKLFCIAKCLVNIKMVNKAADLPKVSINSWPVQMQQKCQVFLLRYFIIPLLFAETKGSDE